KFAEAVWTCGSEIKAVGTTQEVLDASEGIDAERIDCGGRTILPGLNDSHLHVSGVGAMMMQADLMNCRSEEEMIQRCKTFREEHPEYCTQVLVGRGWNQELFESHETPTRQIIDQIATDIPVILIRVCGHVTIANTKAIEMSGYTADSPQPEGGSFLREEDGYPNGIFNETAADKVRALIPRFSIEEIEMQMCNAMNYAIEHGLTSVQSNDARPSIGDLNAFFKLMHRLHDTGKLPIRYRHQVTWEDPDEFLKALEDENGEYQSGAYDDMLSLGPLKIIKDGGIGGRTCLMREDFLDDPGNRGVEVMDQDTINKLCAIADAHDIQVVAHVIGDRAADLILDSYEAVLRDGKNPLRHSLIHLQVSDTPMLERMAKSGILAQYQPIFLQYELHIVEKRVGKELASTSYAFGQAKDLGIHSSYGTDAPVEDCNPFPNIYCAVTRQDFTGQPEGGYAPHQKVDRYEAIDAYTVESAYCEFMEDRKGRIREGWLSDLIVLEQDIFTVPDIEIKDIQVALTMVDGKIVYRRGTV
ncbi:MAG: amidohydrolase, partial [Firmicutes bacterium]|nr:amidohydrolase [Bacillota bacterium]